MKKIVSIFVATLALSLVLIPGVAMAAGEVPGAANLLDYLKPELLVLIPMVWGLGLAVKASSIQNQRIPLVLCIVTVVVALIYVCATSLVATPQEIAMAAFLSITQGVVAWLIAWSLYDKVIKKDLIVNNDGKG